MAGHIENVDELPDIKDVLRLSQGMALVDAILMPEWEFRYFSFDAQWDTTRNEMMASMRDGSGGEYFLLFNENGVVGKVLSEEISNNAQENLTQVPDHFSSFRTEAAFNLGQATYFFWSSEKDGVWTARPNNLPKYDFLRFFVDGPQYYHRWAEDYYEKSIDLSVVEEIFLNLEINEEQIESLNSDVGLEDLAEDIGEILGS